MSDKPNTQKNTPAAKVPAPKPQSTEKPKEIGGRDGPDPVRYGDWELNGKCVDF